MSVGGEIRRGRILAAVVGLVVVLAISACGSSSSSSSSSSSASSPGSSTSSSSSGNSSTAAAQQAVTAAMAAPTKITVTQPLKSKPPAGRTMVWLNCDFVQCDETRAAMAKAAAAAGLNLRAISYKSSDPSTLIAAFKQALQYHPIGVALSGLNSAVWGSQVFPLYRAAHVPIAQGLAGPQPTNDVLVGNLWNQDDLAADAKSLANWVAVDSGGKGQAVVLGVPDFPILGGFASAFSSALKAACPGCAATPINATIPEIGSPSTSNGLLVTAAQKNPAVNYIITSDGALNLGLPAALNGAGLTGKKIAGALGGLENMQNIAQGKEDAFTGQNFNYYAWQLLDTILRANQHLPIAPADGGMPHQLFTKSNVGTPSDQMTAPSDYPAQFKKLWLVG